MQLPSYLLKQKKIDVIDQLTTVWLYENVSLSRIYPKISRVVFGKFPGSRTQVHPHCM